MTDPTSLAVLKSGLRTVRERCRLLADFFSVQADAAFLAIQSPISVDGLNALSEFCRASGDDLERLAHEMPGSIANWRPPTTDLAEP
jgi:hypothetical protein